MSSAIKYLSISLLVASLQLTACRSGPQPTVVVFLLDTVRRDALGCYGNPADSTPQIDALARDGVRFDQALSASGWTLPSVGSLLTGTWPSIHGAVGQGVMLKPLRAEVPTAAEVFKEAGFRTIALTNAAFVSPMVGIDRGFDVFDHKYSYNHDSRSAQLVVDLAIRELHKSRGSPTFLLVHLFDPHLTYSPPSGYDTEFTGGRNTPPPPITMAMCREMQTGPNRSEPPLPEDIDYVRGVYQGEVHFMDAQVGRFIEELRSLGLYDRTTLVLTSDHGEEFWEHGGFEHGHTLYDELIHVPLLVKLPAVLGLRSVTVSKPVRILDVMPTLFDVLDIEPPETFEGQSLMPLVRGEPAEPQPVFAESTLYGAQKIAWRTDRYKYIHDATSGRDGIGELYDWRQDPMETRDLAGEQPELALQMRKELFDFYASLRARARGMSQPETVNLSPVRIQQLRSLGYVR